MHPPLQRPGRPSPVCEVLPDGAVLQSSAHLPVARFPAAALPGLLPVCCGAGLGAWTPPCPPPCLCGDPWSHCAGEGSGSCILVGEQGARGCPWSCPTSCTLAWHQGPVSLLPTAGASCVGLASCSCDSCSCVGLAPGQSSVCWSLSPGHHSALVHGEASGEGGRAAAHGQRELGQGPRQGRHSPGSLSTHVCLCPCPWGSLGAPCVPPSLCSIAHAHGEGVHVPTSACAHMHNTRMKHEGRRGN